MARLAVRVSSDYFDALEELYDKIPEALDVAIKNATLLAGLRAKTLIEKRTRDWTHQPIVEIKHYHDVSKRMSGFIIEIENSESFDWSERGAAPHKIRVRNGYSALMIPRKDAPRRSAPQPLSGPFMVLGTRKARYDFLREHAEQMPERPFVIFQNKRERNEFLMERAALTADKYVYRKAVNHPGFAPLGIGDAAQDDSIEGIINHIDETLGDELGEAINKEYLYVSSQ